MTENKKTYIVDLSADTKPSSCFAPIQNPKPMVKDYRTIKEKLGDPNALLAEALRR
jgi:hypothetical protein